MRATNTMPSGILVIDKPAGPTSHDIVTIAKRITHARKAGHLGTLDPSASGVLPIAINAATKKVNELAGEEKIYEFTLCLGATTDTDDDTGNVISELDAPIFHAEALNKLLLQFTGCIMQTPPKFSAIKIDGKRAYELARKGIEFELKPRPVVIDSIEIIEEKWPEVRLLMSCNSGTYVRSLCRDLGGALGCGGYAKDIRRIRSGPYTIDEAISVDELQKAPQSWIKRLIPV